MFERLFRTVRIVKLNRRNLFICSIEQILYYAIITNIYNFYFTKHKLKHLKLSLDFFGSCFKVNKTKYVKLN